MFPTTTTRQATSSNNNNPLTLARSRPNQSTHNHDNNEDNKLNNNSNSINTRSTSSSRQNNNRADFTTLPITRQLSLFQNYVDDNPRMVKSYINNINTKNNNNNIRPSPRSVNQLHADRDNAIKTFRSTANNSTQNSKKGKTGKLTADEKMRRLFEQTQNGKDPLSKIDLSQIHEYDKLLNLDDIDRLIEDYEKNAKGFKSNESFSFGDPVYDQMLNEIALGAEEETMMPDFDEMNRLTERAGLGRVTLPDYISPDEEAQYTQDLLDVRSLPKDDPRYQEAKESIKKFKEKQERIDIKRTEESLATVRKTYPAFDGLPELSSLSPVKLGNDEVDRLSKLMDLTGSREERESVLQIMMMMENQSALEAMNSLPSQVSKTLFGKPTKEVTLEDLNMYDIHMHENGMGELALSKLPDDEFGFSNLIKKSLDPSQAKHRPSLDLKEDRAAVEASGGYLKPDGTYGITRGKGEDTTRITMKDEMKGYDELLKQIDEFNKQKYPAIAPIDPVSGKFDEKMAEDQFIRNQIFGDPMGELPEDIQRQLDEEMKQKALKYNQTFRGLQNSPADYNPYDDAKKRPLRERGLLGHPKYTTHEDADKLEQLARIVERQREELRDHLRESLKHDSQEYLQFQIAEEEHQKRVNAIKGLQPDSSSATGIKPTWRETSNNIERRKMFEKQEEKDDKVPDTQGDIHRMRDRMNQRAAEKKQRANTLAQDARAVFDEITSRKELITGRQMPEFLRPGESPPLTKEEYIAKYAGRPLDQQRKPNFNEDFDDLYGKKQLTPQQQAEKARKLEAAMKDHHTEYTEYDPTREKGFVNRAIKQNGRKAFEQPSLVDQDDDLQNFAKGAFDNQNSIFNPKNRKRWIE